MPSGAKKRKAAKKKKENQSNNPSHLNAGDEDRERDVGENRWPKSQGEEEEIAQGSRVKSDEKHVDVGESEDDESDKEHERDDDDGGSSRSSSNSDDGNQGGIKNSKAELSIDSTNVGDSASIEATPNSPIDDSAVGVHNEPSPSDISLAAPYVVQSAIKENGDKQLNTSVEDKISIEKTIDQSDANSGNTKSEDPREFVKQDYNDTTALQNNAARPNNHVKDPLVIQPLFPGEKTSWKSCCGLFEVFTRSAA